MTANNLATVFFFTLHVGLDSDDLRYSITGNRERLFSILNHRHFHGYTAVEGIGSFASKQEPCFIITIVYVGDGIGESSFLDYVKDTGIAIKEELGQHEVWITRRTEGLRII